jgi:hypothetical protein
MTKREMKLWQAESIKQAEVRLVQERFAELVRAQRFAGYVA